MSSPKSVGPSGVRLELPFPPRGLSPNSRLTWRAKAKVVAGYREECAWEAVATQVSGPHRKRFKLAPPVEATVTFVVPDRRRRDVDNCLASLKAGFDGLVDAGVFEGDDAARLTILPGPDGWIRVEKGESKVIVELRTERVFHKKPRSRPKAAS